MVSKDIMERLLTETVPTLDSDVRDYLLQGVLSDSDSFSEFDALHDILQGFIDDEVSLERLMDALRHAMDDGGTSNATLDLDQAEAVEDESSAPVLDNSIRRLEKPQTMGGDDSFKSKCPASSEEDALSLCSTQHRAPVVHPKKNRRQLKQQRKEQPSKQNSFDQEDDNDEEGVEESWGGRGRGGRGEYAAAVNSIRSNIHLSNVSILLDSGLDLLSGSPMDIAKGHRYGLIGRNGVGKSTLLRRIALKQIPGMPHDMRIRLVQQHLVGTDVSTLETLVMSDTDRAALVKEQVRVESRLESEQVGDEEVLRLAERLENILVELDAMSAESVEERALKILRGLQFSDQMIHGPTSNLSGGWRMRLSLAQALLTPSDLVLFDECTNHLDLFGLEWLIQYLNSDAELTLIVVSHDTMFLDAICTDVVVLEHQRLTYHPGNYSEYLRQIQEKASRESQILDAAERQRASAQAFVQKQQAMANKKSADPNKQRQAKMIKEKKMERIGSYRDDGKRYKNFSLASLSEKSIRLAQTVHVEIDEPVISMRFPGPAWPPGLGEHESLVCLEAFSFGYDEKLVLDDVTLYLNRRSKAALVGVNGAGKSTLMKLIAGDLIPSDYSSRGRLWSRPSIRVGHVTQYAVEELEQYFHMTVIEYAEEKLRATKGVTSLKNRTSGNIRQYLGAFGLGGRHALQKIDQLSGGERMRLAFATVLADEPHLLCLDESTNHVDLETLSSMSKALNEFDGAVLMISHNQAFLSGFCNELWVLDKGKIDVKYSTESTFDDIFSEYRASILRNESIGAGRQQKAILAKRASKQTTGRKYGALL